MEEAVNTKSWTMRFAFGAGVVLMVGALSSLAEADDRSAALYKQKCAACHGADGKADTPAGKSTKVRSFNDPEVAKLGDEELAGVIEKGKNKMPAYGKSMKPDEIKAMVTYIRSLAK
jgi:cytochrome c6